MWKLFGKLVLLVFGVLSVAGAAVKPSEEMTLHCSAVQQIKLPKVIVAKQSTHYFGRFLIPSVGVDVACYSSMAQSVVDARDSAGYFRACGHRIIADHVHQGFGAIKRCRPGDKAQLVTDDGVEVFTCVAVIQGHNTGTQLTDAAYQPIDELYPDALVCYTCNDTWQNVTIVFFEAE